LSSAAFWFCFCRLRARNQLALTRMNAPATAPIAMPALAPVESEDEAAAVADGEAEVPVVTAPLRTEVIGAAVVVGVEVVVFVGADIGVLELVVLAEVTVEISKPGLKICPVLSSNVSLLAMKRKTHSFVTASSEEGTLRVHGKAPAPDTSTSVTKLIRSAVSKTSDGGVSVLTPDLMTEDVVVEVCDPEIHIRDSGGRSKSCEPSVQVGIPTNVYGETYGDCVSKKSGSHLEPFELEQESISPMRRRLPSEDPWISVVRNKVCARIHSSTLRK
jgi:hypothetical protein